MEKNKNYKKYYPTKLEKTDALIEVSGLENVYIKDESQNIYGTIKDRRNYHIVNEANRLKVDKLVLITSGNNGYSLAKFANDFFVKVVCIVSKDANPKIIDALTNVSHHVIQLNLDEKILRPEEVIAFAREKEDEVIWDVTNGYEEYYESIIDEITKEIGEPKYIVVPVGSGGIFIGLAESIVKRKMNTKVIGIGVQNTTRSAADKLSTLWTPYTKAFQSYEKLGHKIFRLSEGEVKKTYQSFKNVTNCEPSSSVVFAIVNKHQFKKNDKIVLINSGKTVFEDGGFY